MVLGFSALGFTNRFTAEGVGFRAVDTFFRVLRASFSELYAYYVQDETEQPKGTILEPSGSDYGKFYKHDLRFLHHVVNVGTMVHPAHNIWTPSYDG